MCARCWWKIWVWFTLKNFFESIKISSWIKIDNFSWAYDHIKEFIEVYFNKEDRNRSVISVFNHVNNSVYLAGCRALDIIDKLLTGPLWRIIENVEHTLDLNNTWLVFENSIELLSKDASELIDGKIFYPELMSLINILYFLQNLKFCLRILWEEHDTSQNIQNLRSIACCIQNKFFNRMLWIDTCFYSYCLSILWDVILVHCT